MNGLTEIERAYVHLLQRTLDEQLVPRVLVASDGETYPALVDQDTHEVLAILCMPPRVIDANKVVN